MEVLMVQLRFVGPLITKLPYWSGMVTGASRFLSRMEHSCVSSILTCRESSGGEVRTELKRIPLATFTLPHENGQAFRYTIRREAESFCLARTHRDQGMGSSIPLVWRWAMARCLSVTGTIIESRCLQPVGHGSKTLAVLVGGTCRIHVGLRWMRRATFTSIAIRTVRWRSSTRTTILSNDLVPRVQETVSSTASWKWQSAPITGSMWSIIAATESRFLIWRETLLANSVSTDPGMVSFNILGGLLCPPIGST